MLIGKKRLCLRMIGGLGNQLFAYSYSRSLAEKSGRKLIIDNSTGFIKDIYKRKSRVKSFLSDYSEASLLDKSLFFLTKYLPRTSNLLFNSIYLKEQDSRSLVFYDLAEMHKIKFVFIEGYFQSYLYFEKYAKIITNEISFKFQKNSQINDLINQIDHYNSVSLHVRRIDYDPKLEIHYYVNAASLIYKSVKNPHFFIFSDDIPWCKEHLTFLQQKTFVSHNYQDEVIDLKLISNCKHHIIANSSFSWWGAWLGKYSSKIVIAPLKTQIGVIDYLYPKDWILI